MAAGLPVLAQLRLQTVRNSLGSLRKQSNLKVFVIVFFALGLWIGFFFLFRDGFCFLATEMMGDFRVLIVDILFAIFFLSLFVMLVFSNGIITYGSLFRSPETAFLFSRPFSASRIYVYKLSETLLFSSWAFLFLALPLIVAFGVTDHARWYYYPGAAVFFAVFAGLPAALGGIITLLITRFFTRSPRRILAVAILATIVLGLAWALGLAKAYRIGAGQSGMLWMRNVLGQLTLSQSPILPSYWISSGVQHLARGELAEAGYRFLLLLSTALFVATLGCHLARWLYAPAYHRVQCRSRVPRRGGEGWVYRLAERLLFGMKRELRILIIKDFKTFVRDPVQWSQVLIFFGLLGVYFINMRNVQGDIDSAFWNNLINLLNLIATSLTMSTFTSRFIFPLVSLEGRKFWILGLLPVERRDLIYSKFWFAFAGSFLLSEGLMLISDLILRVPWPVMVLHGLTVLVICAGLSGLAVGVGALYPNMRESNPSKIVSGFGGTLNLVLSLLFVAAVVILMAVPYHVGAMGRLANIEPLRRMLIPAGLVALVVGALATVLPLRLGVRAFERLEA